LYSSSEFVTLSGKHVGAITVYPIVEIRIAGGESGGLVEAVPVALVLKAAEGILTCLIDNIKTSDGLSAG
jgi:hypothetical protein